VRIAYMILAHDQPELFGRLLHAIHADGVTVYAHIDAKSDQRTFENASKRAAIQFVPAPIKVNWGGFSQVAATVKLLEHAQTHGRHDYYIFLSGRDYPLLPHRSLLALLEQNPTRSYMNFYALAEGTDFVGKIRNYCYYDLYALLPTRFLRRAANRIVREISARLPDRRFVRNMQAYRGSTSWCLTEQIVGHLLAFIHDPLNASYINFFRSVSCCDEIFFQTIVLNSPYANTLHLYDQDGRRPPGEMRNENKAYLHYVDWNPQRENPAVLDESDFDALYASGKYFARKFDSAKSARLLDRIDALRSGQPEQTTC
jgi:hypothetical protein